MRSTMTSTPPYSYVWSPSRYRSSKKSWYRRPEQPPGWTAMRSRRSSRPSWSSNALTLAAAGSLSRTPVVPAVLLSRVVLSCTDMLCPPGSGYPLRTFPPRTNTAVAEPVPLYGDGVGFRVVRARSTDGARRLRAREAPPARPPRPRRDDHRCLGRAERAADQGIREGSPDAEA